MIIVHAAKKADWKKGLTNATYLPDRFEKDGFIHCSEIENIVDVANDNLKDIDEKLFLLCIDTEKLDSEIRWEERGGKGISFPHVYGPINISAVIDVIDFQKDCNNMFYYPDEILQYVKYEKSCGAIILHKFKSERKVLLINHVHGTHWAFPKGHMEGAETEKQTALREIREETGLEVSLDTGFRYTIRYSPEKGVIKDVLYFIAKAEKTEGNIQAEELNCAKWCSFDEARRLITFKNNLLAFNAAVDYLSKAKRADNAEFWELLDRLVRECEITIDRPKGTSHPKFEEAVYPLDYGYLEGTTSADDEGMDVFVGSDACKKVTGVLCTVDIMNKDSEMKILLGCTDDEQKTAHEFLNATDFMKNILIKREIH